MPERFLPSAAREIRYGEGRRMMLVHDIEHCIDLMRVARGEVAAPDPYVTCHVLMERCRLAAEALEMSSEWQDAMARIADHLAALEDLCAAIWDQWDEVHARWCEVASRDRGRITEAGVSRWIQRVIGEVTTLDEVLARLQDRARRLGLSPQRTTARICGLRNALSRVSVGDPDAENRRYQITHERLAAWAREMDEMESPRSEPPAPDPQPLGSGPRPRNLRIIN